MTFKPLFAAFLAGIAFTMLVQAGGDKTPEPQDCTNFTKHPPSTPAHSPQP
jgi:hypothetical protein